jgi:hypothetical protein
MNKAKIVDLFKHVDACGNDTLTLDELRRAFSDPDIKSYLHALDLDVQDVALLFSMLDSDGDALISMTEFSNGILRLRGAATSYDVKHLLQQVQNISNQMVHLNRKLPIDTSCTMGTPT